jgi:transposase
MKEEGERERYWKAHWAAWQSSGLSQRGYCQQQGLSYSAFGYWRGRLKAMASMPTTFVPVLIEGPSVTVEAAEVVVGSGSPAPICSGLGTGVEVRLAHGRTIVVAENFDESVLARVIRVVEQVPC